MYIVPHARRVSPLSSRKNKKRLRIMENTKVRKTLSKQIKQLVGNVCCNCGTDKNIEYHHIVPLALGGRDIESNMVPLCHQCHKAAHCGQHISHYRKSINGGRKPKASAEKHSEIFDMYISGEIGRKEVQLLLNYSSKTTLISRPLFKRYLQSKGIRQVRNLVDMVATNNETGLINGCCVGEIEYLDGRKENIYYKDTGMNDVEYVRRKQHETVKIFKDKVG